MDLPLSAAHAGLSDQMDMRVRILATLGGGVSGFLLAYAFPIDATLGLSPALTEAACTLAGLIVGYLGTFLLDVFLTSSD